VLRQAGGASGTPVEQIAALEAANEGVVAAQALP